MNIFKKIKEYLLLDELRQISHEEIPEFIEKNYPSVSESYPKFLEFLNSPVNHPKEKINQYAYKIIEWLDCFGSEKKHDFLSKNSYFYHKENASLQLLFFKTQKDEYLRATMLRGCLAYNKYGFFELDDLMSETMVHPVMKEVIRVSGEDVLLFINHMCRKQVACNPPAQLYSEVLQENPQLVNAHYLSQIIKTRSLNGSEPGMKNFLSIFLDSPADEHDKIMQILKEENQTIAIMFEKLLLDSKIDKSAMLVSQPKVRI